MLELDLLLLHVRVFILDGSCLLLVTLDGLGQLHDQLFTLLKEHRRFLSAGKLIHLVTCRHVSQSILLVLEGRDHSLRL